MQFCLFAMFDAIDESVSMFSWTNRTCMCSSYEVSIFFKNNLQVIPMIMLLLLPIFVGMIWLKNLQPSHMFNLKEFEQFEPETPETELLESEYLLLKSKKDKVGKGITKKD